uniref:BolA-like protein 2 n=2 Tax=Cyprinodon variegatus TaxID=28743 RepID=A0A3Q2CNR1_CYPVA
MAVSADHIRDKLTKELGAVHVVGLRLHGMVNTCLAEELKEIHAFEQKTLTPEQWDKQKLQ